MLRYDTNFMKSLNQWTALASLSNWLKYLLYKNDLHSKKNIKNKHLIVYIEPSYLKALHVVSTNKKFEIIAIMRKVLITADRTQIKLIFQWSEKLWSYYRYVYNVQ